MKKVLDDPRTAPIDPKLRATLAFLEKMTRSPSELTADDARAVLALGVSKAALADAIYVASTFNIYDRLDGLKLEAQVAAWLEEKVTSGSRS